MGTVEIPKSVMQQGQRLQKALAKAAEAARNNQASLIKLYETFQKRVAEEAASHDEAIRTAANNLRSWMEETIAEYSNTDDPYNSPWDEAYTSAEEVGGVDGEETIYEMPAAEDILRLRLDDLPAVLESLSASWEEDDE